MSEPQKLEKVNLLKVYLSEHTDAQLETALRQVNWDADKALDLLMEKNFDSRNSANQKNLSEINQ